MFSNFEPHLSVVIKQGNPRRKGCVEYLPFKLSYRRNGYAWETGMEQNFALQPLQALAAVKQEKFLRRVSVQTSPALLGQKESVQKILSSAQGCCSWLMSHLLTVLLPCNFQHRFLLLVRLPSLVFVFRGCVRDSSKASKKHMQVQCLCCQELCNTWDGDCWRHSSTSHLLRYS